MSILLQEQTVAFWRQDDHNVQPQNHQQRTWPDWGQAPTLFSALLPSGKGAIGPKDVLIPKQGAFSGEFSRFASGLDRDESRPSGFPNDAEMQRLGR